MKNGSEIFLYMHISIQFCLDFFITSRSIHVVLINWILVYFRFVSHFSIFRFVAFCFAFQYISLRCVSFRILVYFVAFRNISFRFVRCVSISLRSLVQPLGSLGRKGFDNVLLYTAGNRHKQNSRFCKKIREDNFRFWWRRVHEDASQGMYMSKIEICFFTARILQNQRMLCCGECFHD